MSLNTFADGEDEPANSSELSSISNSLRESTESLEPWILQSFFNNANVNHLNSSYESLDNHETPNTSRQNDQTYVCGLCGLITPSAMELARHARNHFSLLYECSLCTARCKTATNRNKHERLAHRLHRPNEMSEFKEKLTVAELALIEQATGSFVAQWSCDICNLTFINRYLLDEHNKTLHSTHKFQCTFCEKVFPTYRRRNLHEHKSHRFVRQPEYTRTIKGSLHFGQPKKSNEQYSSINASQMTTNTSGACRFCGFVVSKRGPLKLHEISHTRKQTAYQCHLCKLYFKSNQLKVAHQTAYCCDGRASSFVPDGQNPVPAFTSSNIRELQTIQQDFNLTSPTPSEMNLSFTSNSGAENSAADVISMNSSRKSQSNAETEESALCPAFSRLTTIDVQPISSMLLMQELAKNPTLIYYDVDALSSRFHILPVEHWMNSDACEFLMLRVFAGKKYDFNMGLFEPVWSTSIPRYELPRNLSRDSHVVCFCKPNSIEKLIRAHNTMNSHMNFIELTAMLIPALQLQRSLVIATDHDRQLIDKMDLKSHRIHIF
ncbi:hypothetical protein M3Y98_00910700 [Aphelenchoides besseyi]|nr:hypothetical protein M3Y98_00910700 [Aphelenchoides besseyi]